MYPPLNFAQLDSGYHQVARIYKAQYVGRYLFQCLFVYFRILHMIRWATTENKIIFRLHLGTGG